MTNKKIILFHSWLEMCTLNVSGQLNLQKLRLLSRLVVKVCPFVVVTSNHNDLSLKNFFKKIHLVQSHYWEFNL